MLMHALVDHIELLYLLSDALGDDDGVVHGADVLRV